MSASRLRKFAILGAMILSACGVVLLSLSRIFFSRELSASSESSVSHRDASQSASSASRALALNLQGDWNIREWHQVEGLPDALAQFESVFWEPDDTTSLRVYLQTEVDLSGASVLEIGTGTGLIALWCCQLGVASVVATDINPAAVANAKYNAMHLGVDDRIDVRRVSAAEPGPFVVIGQRERFDFVVTNPPWEDAPVTEDAAHALYDPGFQLLDALLSDASQHLKPDGRLLLAYGARGAIQRIMEKAPMLGWKVRLYDERELDALPEVFLPGMLLELTRIAQ